jgi:hypothetical protein
MAQDAGKILPLFINTDKVLDRLGPEESPFIKGLTWDINGNPDTSTNNSSGEGQNMYVLSPTRSNAQLPDAVKPAGINKNVGSYESPNTRELYYFNYNSLLNHGIYVVNGDTGVWQKVVVDPKLAFSNDQEAFISELRVSLRYVKDRDGNIIEKHLFWTDGKKWQGWINVTAAIATNGFDASLYPYWALTPPHFDREELLEWPVRPPMIRPEVTPIENTASDTGKINRLVDTGFRFCIAFKTTDGRKTTPGPYSNPLLVKTEEFLNNPENLPKNAVITLPAGSPLTEQIEIYVQKSDPGKTLDALAVWGDWMLYDTIDKFDQPPAGNYWERTGAWADYNYDVEFNTIEYTFDNSKLGTIVSQIDMSMLQTGMPQISQAMTDVGDASILINNRYKYDNFSKELLDKLSVLVKEKEQQTCSVPMRKVYLYAYVGMCNNNFSYISQVGYYIGEDTQMRFGGLRPQAEPEDMVNGDESKYFKLDFADRDAFRCYMKGTNFYADGEWYQVNSDNSLVKIEDLLDFSNRDVVQYAQGVFSSGGYFVCRFEFNIPAGRYVAAIGRHNTPSSGDYRGTSTYVYGIANSRIKSNTGGGSTFAVTIKPNAIGSFSKEMEIDCTAGDLDVWGNNRDLFYIYCPYYSVEEGNGNFRFVEGYLRESAANSIPVELFPYRLFEGGNDATDDCGDFTDKNGFYWAYTKVRESDDADIRFTVRLNCAYPTVFTVPTSQGGNGWKQNSPAYLANNNGGEVGDCNRVLLQGSVKNIAGTIGYSNIAITIRDGATVYTDTNGEFTLIIHNGMTGARANNIYVNAGSNFLITLANCGQIPLFSYNEFLIPCVDCNERIYPVPIHLNVEIQSNTQTSLKEGGKYYVGLVGADLAGRLMRVNPIGPAEVSTFLQRDNINATYLQLLINSALNIAAENPDIKWVAPYVSKNVVHKRYLQWVGDSLVYLDNNGNVVTDPIAAVYVKIVIDSLFQTNVTNNFSLLSTYQFVKGDRIRFLDDGDGNLFDTATYGDPINVQVLGTNYLQAAINAGLVPPQTNTVIDNNQTSDEEQIGLIVKYDARLDRLNEKEGFWIEVYTPSKDSDVIPFFEMAGFYPVIGGEVVRYTGLSGGQPSYAAIASLDLEFWDTYYLQRSISGKFFNHPFESPNVTDNWGANLTSGGRLNSEDKSEKQIWLGGDVARSDSFMKQSSYNGLAMFRDENRKNYGIYPFGEILAAHTKRNIIAFICANDWFTVDFDMPYSKATPNGLIVTNLDENLSKPHQKTGGVFGMSRRDIGTIIVDSDAFYWYDAKNTAFVKCNYGEAIDIAEGVGNERGGLHSYLNAKTSFVNLWNNDSEDKDKFDVIAGLDAERGNIYLTFRPRRNNSVNPASFVSQRRFLDVKHQETFVYSIHNKGWVPMANFTPESYGRLRGSWANEEFFAFAAGIPYRHNGTSNDSYLNYFGVQTEPVVSVVANKNASQVSVFQAVSQNINGSVLFADLIYDTQANGLSYIPLSAISEKELRVYAPLLRNMVSYPPIEPEDLFRTMLHDGKRIFGSYAVCRFVQRYADLGSYFQLSSLDYLFTNSATTKP